MSNGWHAYCDLYVIAARDDYNTPAAEGVWTDREGAVAEAVRRTALGGHSYRVVSLDEMLLALRREAGDNRMTDPKPMNIAQARDLLRPGMYAFAPQGDLRVDNVTGTLQYQQREDEPYRAILRASELDRPDWKTLVKERMGWPRE